MHRYYQNLLSASMSSLFYGKKKKKQDLISVCKPTDTHQNIQTGFKLQYLYSTKELLRAHWTVSVLLHCMVNQATSDHKNWKDIFVLNYVQMSSDQWQYAPFSSDSLFQCNHYSAQPAHQRQTGAQLSGHDCTFWLVQKISRSVLELGYAFLMHLLFQLLCQTPWLNLQGAWAALVHLHAITMSCKCIFYMF